MNTRTFGIWHFSGLFFEEFDNWCCNQTNNHHQHSAVLQLPYITQPQAWSRLVKLFFFIQLKDFSHSFASLKTTKKIKSSTCFISRLLVRKTMLWNPLLGTFVFKPLNNCSPRNVWNMHNITNHCILHCSSRQTGKDIEVNKLWNKENCKIIILTTKTHACHF